MTVSKPKSRQRTKLEPEQWILLVSVVLLLGLVITALNPDALHQQPVVNRLPVQGQNSQMQSARMQQPSGQNVVAPMKPLVASPLRPYQGVVAQIINRDPGGWGQIHVIVRDPVGNRREISLAPVWYMEFEGCALRVGQSVRGEVFRFDKGANPGAVAYAKSVIVNGTRCRLRTVDGLAIWSDQLQ